MHTSFLCEEIKSLHNTIIFVGSVAPLFYIQGPIRDATLYYQLIRGTFYKAHIEEEKVDYDTLDI